jgi:hypothetical protein
MIRIRRIMAIADQDPCPLINLPGVVRDFQDALQLRLIHRRQPMHKFPIHREKARVMARLY